MKERDRTQLRLELIRLRANASERERWSTAAQAAGMTLSGFVREAVEDAVATRAHEAERGNVEPCGELVIPLARAAPSLEELPLEERLAALEALAAGLGRSSG